MQCRKCRVVLSVVVIVPQKNATIAISILATKKLATNDRMQRLLHLFVCLDRVLAQFPLWWCQVNGVQSSYCNDFEKKVELAQGWA